MPLIRYPGSKAKLANQILAFFPQEMNVPLHAHKARWEYREPFLGAGAVGFEALKAFSSHARVWLNDKDRWLVSLWISVWKQPEALKHLISSFTPSTEAFYEFKSQDGDESVRQIDAGFRKLALHQMSISGFGAMSGGPLGGRLQENAAYPVACRWNAQTLKSHVTRLHNYLRVFRNLQITCGDFEELLFDAPKSCFIYLDPPYVLKGEQLYKHNMTEQDHWRLAAAVRRLECPWLLSYDDDQLVRRLYSWARISELEVTYTNATHAKGKRPKNREIVIFPAA